MTTIKSYTDIEQSKKLVEILPLESADMTWQVFKKNRILYLGFHAERYNNYSNELIPAWSLAALLNIIPFGCNIERTKKSVTMIYYYKKKEVTVFSDNFVDACVEMILKLNELDLL